MLQNGWTVAPEEDFNSWKGMVYLERYPDMRPVNWAPSPPLAPWWKLILARVFGRKIVSFSETIDPCDDDVKMRVVAYEWRGDIYIASIEEVWEER